MVKALFDREYDEYYVNMYRIASLILAVPIVAVNTFLLVLLFRMRLVISISHQIILLLALSDLLHGIIIVSARIIEYFLGAKVIVEQAWFCQYLGTISLGLILMSAFLVGLLTIERYWLVCRYREINPNILRITIISMGFIYTLPLMMTAIYKDLGPDPIYGYCLPISSIWAKLLSFLLVTSFVVTITIVVVCYIAISKRCFEVLPKIDSDPVKLRNNKLRVAIKSLTFIILYTVCYLPKFISSIWLRTSFITGYPPFLDVIAPLAIVLTHLLNPLLILSIHTQFRREANSLLKSSSSHNRCSTDSSVKFFA